ncbi:hypothetical protein TNCV_3750861 [Trichonephila clavipes]|uniref:Uncharacterized protein n=1 Tax=Trichonephila clavipes TaxID=2585209 RepID=A0A8X6R1S5_TRICX|nr:hypothetical protein TNCV_3750861 [Trichonephila clavipes]
MGWCMNHTICCGVAGTFCSNSGRRGKLVYVQVSSILPRRSKSLHSFGHAPCLAYLPPKVTRHRRLVTATAGSNVVQSGRRIFDDFFQHLWPYIGNNTANVVFQMVKRLWLIRIDQWLYIAPQKIV